MSEKTLIAWTDRTFSAVWGCTKVSPGCTNCYADAYSQRRTGEEFWGPKSPRRILSDDTWQKPHRYNRQAIKIGHSLRVFCGSMFDWLDPHPIVTAALPRLWQLIRDTPWLDWQLLTKRPERILAALPDDWGDGFENVWLGTSIENTDYAWRADELRQVPARVRFISYEPALGPLDQLDLAAIHWLIYGGESGANRRPEDKQWARDIMARCRSAGVAFFHKQSSAFQSERGIELDGVVYHEFPIPRRTVAPAAAAAC
jgi:protein gp37